MRSSGWARAMAVVLALSILPIAVPDVAEPVAAAGESPFRVRQFDLRDLRADQLPWTSEPPHPVPPKKPRDRIGVPLFRWRDGKLYYRPGALAINGMKRIDTYLETGNKRQLKQALKQAERLRRMSLQRRRANWLPFWFDYPEAAQRAPWFNAMSQGLALSFYVRLYEVTGKKFHLEAARKVFRSFDRFSRGGKKPWVSHVDSRRYLWLEHYPRAAPDHVLNAHIHAVIGLYEYWRATGSARSERFLLGSITTLKDNLRRFRRPGGLSIYGLRSRTRISKYHEVHIWQVKVVGQITGDPYFRKFAHRLARDRKPTGYIPGRPAAQLRDGVTAVARDGTRTFAKK